MLEIQIHQIEPAPTWPDRRETGPFSCIACSRPVGSRGIDQRSWRAIESW
jgi:hypothetical protein